MSLRTRLLVMIVLLVTVIVCLMSALHLNSLVEIWSDDVYARAELVAQYVKFIVVNRIDERSAGMSPPPVTLAELKGRWLEIVRGDPYLAQLVHDALLPQAKMLVEVSIAGEYGEILASSDPTRVGRIMRRLPSFKELISRPVVDRLIELRQGDRDYELTVPLTALNTQGVPQQNRPIFTIQVIVSNVVLKSAILPQAWNLGMVSALSLLMSILLGAFSANLAIGPLDAIARELDRLAAGQVTRSRQNPDLGRTRELAIVQSKLNLLGQQIRGAQEDALQMRSNIEGLMQRMEDAVLLFDKDDRLILVGPSADRILETPRHAILGKQLEEVFPPSGSIGRAIQESIRLRSAARDQLVTFDRHDGPPVRLLLSVNPLAGQTGTLVTLRDADTRRQLATQLDISRRLAAISRLTGGVAHEIKNPLNSISLRLELLRTRLGDNDMAGEEINLISQEIRRLDRVVKTFLDFTRPLDLKVEELDLAGLAREIASLVRPQAELQGVKIEFSADDEPIRVRGDRDLLKQAILNIIVNGIEAMKQGGTLTVQARQLEDHTLLTIQDEGPGIPEANRSKVFQLYFTTKEKGTGIGLAMTFRAVQLHNGTIDFVSEAGKGTVFRLKFPLSSEAA